MATSLSEVLTTELQVVNEMLAAVDIAPVTSITGSNDLEVEIAINRFDHANREVQAKGWSWNNRFEVNYTRDGSNNITLGSDILKIRGSGISMGRDYTTQGRLLFDRDPDVDSTTLDRDAELDITTLLQFETLPQSARDYIKNLSIFRHERMESADDTKRTVTEKNLSDSWTDLINNESEQGPGRGKTLMDNPDVGSSIFGRL